jgi:hypothetical protein
MHFFVINDSDECYTRGRGQTERYKRAEDDNVNEKHLAHIFPYVKFFFLH